MRTIQAFLVCGCLVMSLGCAMCDSSQDCKYASYGGAVERLDMVNGRVNSILNPASISRTDGGFPSQELAPNKLSPTPAGVAPEEAPPAEPSLEDEAAEQRSGSSPLDELDKLPRSGNDVQERLDNLNIPGDDGDPSIPNSDSDRSPSLDDLFDDMTDET